MNDFLNAFEEKIRIFLPTKITVKFSLTIGLLLSILLFEAVIGYSALTVVWESNNDILANTEIQRLAMGMSHNWESVKRLRRSFFSQSPYIGVDEAYENYAIPAGGEISEVIRDGAALIRQASAKNTGGGSPESILDLQDYLARVSQYADTLEEATDLEFRLNARDSGLQPQLEQTAADLKSILEAAEQPGELLGVYFEMRYLEKDIFDKSRLLSRENIFTAATRLRLMIETSTLPPEEKNAAQTMLNDYEITAEEIVSTVLQIEERRTHLDLLDQTIEPILIEMLASVDTEVRLARVQIEETRRFTLRILAGAAIAGLLAAGTTAVVFHMTMTRKIVKLTRVARKFQVGDMDARADLGSNDELGELAITFDNLAGSVKRLTAELREQAIRDSLTGLYNRRYLDETLQQELSRSLRSGKPVSLVMIDMDHLKEVNDAHGHAWGDKMLIKLAQILSSQTRYGSIACRFGGDEFVILMPGATLEVGLRRAREWKRQFKASDLPDGGELITSSLSAGVAEWITGESHDQLISRADEALYRAKNKGRNRIVTANYQDH